MDDADDDDELKGLRIHAWVLVLPGRREIAESFFIEPSTGKVHTTTDSNVRLANCSISVLRASSVRATIGSTCRSVTPG
jgi:hypothetical protein